MFLPTIRTDGCTGCQTGVGTFSTTKFLMPGMTLVSKAVDQGVALNLEEHVGT